MSRTRATYTTHNFSIGTIDSVLSRLAFAATGQCVYVRAVYTDHAAGFTCHATPALVPTGAFFARPGPVIRRTLSELLRQPVPPRSLVNSMRSLAGSIAMNLARNPSFAHVPVVPLDMRIHVWPIPSHEDEGEEEEVEYRQLVDQVAELSLAEVEDRLYPADESAIEAMIEAADSGGACRDHGDIRCVICLEEFGGPTVDDDDDDDDFDREKIVPMPCSHVYHHKCIVEWLRRNHKCPLCRFSMPVAAILSD